MTQHEDDLGHEMSLSYEEAEYYADLEARLCRCDGDDTTRCYPHNERFHSMEGVEEYDRLYGPLPWPRW